MSSHPLSIASLHRPDLQCANRLGHRQIRCRCQVVSCSQRYNVAAKLIIRRFKEGVTSSCALSQELIGILVLRDQKEFSVSFSRTRASIQDLRVSSS